MSENDHRKPESECTDLVPLRRMNPFSAWRILRFLLRKLEERRRM